MKFDLSPVEKDESGKESVSAPLHQEANGGHV